jgi:hypothetical protein
MNRMKLQRIITLHIIHEASKRYESALDRADNINLLAPEFYI